MTHPSFAGQPAFIGAGGSAETDPVDRPARLRFAAFTFQRLPSGLAAADVTLEWKDGVRYCGHAEGVSSSFADLRLAVEAALKAIAEFTRHEGVFELVGVKALRAFDANVVLVSILSKRDGKSQQLLGCRLAEGDLLRSAVLATLQATNRVMGTGSEA